MTDIEKYKYKEGHMKGKSREQLVDELAIKEVMRRVDKVIKRYIFKYEKEGLSSVVFPSGGAKFISPKLLILGQYTEENKNEFAEWAPKEDDGVFLHELFLSTHAEWDETDDSAHYYLLKTPTSDFFLKFERGRLEIVRRVPTSFIKREIGTLMECIAEEIVRCV